MHSRDKEPEEKINSKINLKMIDHAICLPLIKAKVFSPDSPRFCIDWRAIRMAMKNMTLLMIKTQMIGATKAQIRPLPVSNQQLQ